MVFVWLKIAASAAIRLRLCFLNEVRLFLVVQIQFVVVARGRGCADKSRTNQTCTLSTNYGVVARDCSGVAIACVVCRVSCGPRVFLGGKLGITWIKRTKRL